MTESTKLIPPTRRELQKRNNLIERLVAEGKNANDIAVNHLDGKHKKATGKTNWQGAEVTTLIKKLSANWIQTTVDSIDTIEPLTTATGGAITTTEPDSIVVTVPEVEANVDDVTAHISLFTNTGGYLCKEFGIDIEGNIAKLSHGNLYQGNVETLRLSLLGLKETIEGLRNNQAFGLGVRKPEYEHLTQINTTAKIVPSYSIARTKDKKDGTIGFFEFNDQPAFMLLDYDDKELSPLEVHAKLLEIIPEFTGCGALIVPSSSAGIYRSTEQPRAEIKASCHIYMIVERGACIPDIAKFIEYRAWLNDCGRIDLDVRGYEHKNHLFDKAVFSPERLVFEAPPILKDDLKQSPRTITYIRGGVIKC